jgi:hypothetical protein
MWFPAVRYIWTIKMRDGRAGLLPATSLSPDANQPPMRNRFETGGRRGGCLQALAKFPLVLPAASQLDQLNALAAVARKLRDREVLRMLRLATSGTELYRVVTE